MDTFRPQPPEDTTRELPPPIQEKSVTPERRPESVVSALYETTAAQENYEDAVIASDGVEALVDFRKKMWKVSFASFHELVETITHINKLRLPEAEREQQVASVVEAMQDRAQRLSPRVADLYQAMLAKVSGAPYTPSFEMTGEKMGELEQDGDLDLLFADDVAWDMKANRIEKRLAGYLSGARAFDKREGKEMDDDVREWRKEQLANAPTRPPQRQNESKPGVDPMERLKEGERAPAIWSIFPAWGGYYKEQSFSTWDNERNTWVADEYQYEEATLVPLSGNQDAKKGPIDVVMSAKTLAGQWISLPIPYTHDLHKIEAGGRPYQVQKDQNGDLVIFVEGNGEEVGIEVFLAPNPNKKFTAKKSETVKIPQFRSEFSEETLAALAKITTTKKGNIARADAIKRYVMGRIKYLAPKDIQEATLYNNAYRTSEKGFASAVDELRKGDCDVVNTYYAALCAELRVPVRHAVGHSVKGKDLRGASNINSGTGHAWSEVLNETTKEWVRIDATPSGDPNLDEEKDKSEGEGAPGDYGSQEAVRPTDEQLEALRKKLAEQKEHLSYTKEERHLSESTGVDLKEARQIVKEINEADKTRMPNGERITDALARVFGAIVESRKTNVPAYDGPVRKREGGERIEDIVRHVIGKRAGDSDPVSRELPTEDVKEEKLLGGFDLYMIGDKSGSMGSSVDGEELWKMQRRAEYLIFSSIHRFARELQRASLQEENNLSVRTQGISFRGNAPDDIDLDKPLSSKFAELDKVKMWHSIGTQGSGNGDVAALSYVYEQIKKEIADNKERGIIDNRLRLVIACSDGGPDSPEGVQMMAEKIGQLNAVVVGMGLTETAAAVPIIYNTPYSRGDIAKSINDLPALVAKHIIMESLRLFPEKAQANAQEIVNTILSKFKTV